MALRRLTALMFTDMVGYSALARENEELARELVREQRAVIRTLLPSYGGTEKQTTGDGFFVEFSSVVDAVLCAINIQTTIRERDNHLPSERRIQLRIAVHLCDVIADQTGDFYGNGVNVAARVEALAPIGGVCFTRQVYDHVEGHIGLGIQKIGHRSLKNIRGGAELYRVVFPWETASSNFTSRLLRSWRDRFQEATINSAFLGALFLGCLTILGIAFQHSTHRHAPIIETVSRTPERTIASDSTIHHRIDLSSGWNYTLDPNIEETKDWKSFDPKNPWKYSEEIQGRYWLKKSFNVHETFQYPAIVLGLIPDSHRVYLNGHFIGGSDQMDLALYPFDMSILHTDSPNVITVTAVTRPTLDPGLIWIGDVGSYLGEFADVRQNVVQNQQSFHTRSTIYLALSLAVALSTLVFAILRSSNRHYLYCSFFLLLGSIHLAFYNPTIYGSLDYSFSRFMKIIALSLSPFVLYSTQLYLRRRQRAEAVNNGVALLYALATAGVLLIPHYTPGTFLNAYNWTSIASALYTFGWVTAVLISTVQNWKKTPAQAESVSNVYECATIVFGIFCGIALLATIRSEVIASVIPMLYTVLRMSLAIPFLFSLLVLSTATADFTMQSRTAARKASRDQLILGLIRLISGSPEVTTTIQTIQDRLAEFLKARRSTLYVLSGDGPEMQSLRADYVLGNEITRHEVKRVIRPDRGIIGYSITHRTPLLIEDIRKDPRFDRNIQDVQSYRTGACMIFPLLSADRLIGVLTFADKEGDRPFSSDDFTTALEVSTDLALLLDNRNLQESLRKYLMNQAS